MAPQSSNECHFFNWSIHSDRMLTLWPGEVINMGVVADEELTDDFATEAEADTDALAVEADLKNRLSGGWVMESCFPSSII